MKRDIVLLVLIIILVYVSFPLLAIDIQIDAVVEKDTLSVGESFIYQIQINGSDKASGFPEDRWADPGFTRNFNVEFLGGQNNSSRQVSIINGRRKETVNNAYIISYSLTPLAVGSLTIPSVTLFIDGNKYTTRTIKIESREAGESENLNLIVSLDKNEAYVGEALVITFTWYIGLNIKDFYFSIPFFQDKNFSFLDPSGLNPDPSSLVRFPVDGDTITATQGKGTLEGKSYTTVTFSKLVIPKSTGNFTIPKSVIYVSAQISSPGRNNDMFNSFFSSFSSDYEHFTVPSNDLSLKVMELPPKGKPDNFNGYIGELNIETTAKPVEVRVGDPITFSIRIDGPKNIGDWNPPDLNKQYELASNFKMPSEISAGRIEGNSVVFTQTIRSLNDTVSQIPALEIPFFDTLKGAYRIARSQAIPITVFKGSAVRVEGSSIINSSDIHQEIVESSNNGINFNYDDIKILKNQSYGLKVLGQFPLIILLIMPPLFFFGILIFINKRKFFAARAGRKNTFSELRKELKKVEYNSEISPEEAGSKVKILFLKFMSNKISGSSGSVNEGAVKNWLMNKGLNVDDFYMIFDVFSLLDEFQYAGGNIQRKDCYLQLQNLIHKLILSVEDFEGRILK